jgi:hypothetical protein
MFDFALLRKAHSDAETHRVIGWAIVGPNAGDKPVWKSNGHGNLFRSPLNAKLAPCPGIRWPKMPNQSCC